MQLIFDTTKDSRKDAELFISFLSAYYGITDATAPFLMPVPTGTAPAGPMEVKSAAEVFAPLVPPAAVAAPAPIAPVPAGSPVPPTTVQSVPIAAAADGTAPPPAPVVDVSALQEVDSSGLPWDERIHSKAGDGSHPKNADGTWRSRRGVQPTQVRQVEAELRARTASPAPVTAPAVPTPTPPAPPAAVTPPPAPVTAPAVPTPTPPAPPAAPADFTQLTQRLVPLVVQGKLPGGILNEAAVAVGLADGPALATRPDLVGMAWLTLLAKYPEQLAAK